MENIKCGIVFLSQEGLTIFHCTLCDEIEIFKKIEKFGLHIIEKHYEPLDDDDDFGMPDFMPNISDIISTEDGLQIENLDDENFGTDPLIDATNILSKSENSDSQGKSDDDENEDQYDKQCGEVELTQKGMIIFICTICESKYEGIRHFSQHVVREHYNAEILDEVHLEFYTDESTVISTENCYVEGGENDGKGNDDSDGSSNSIINFNRLNSRSVQSKSDDEAEFYKPKRPVGKWRQYFEVILWTSTNEQRYKCKKCGVVIRDRTNVHHHINRVHELLREHTCPECQRQFHSRTELKIHTRKHTGERPYLCMECGMAFISASVLHRHRSTHHVVHVRDKNCTICGKSFFHKRDLRHHQRHVHSEERPFKCKVCGALFKLNSVLQTHMRIHEDKRQFKCNLCRASYNYKSILDSHMKRKHALAPPDI